MSNNKLQRNLCSKLIPCIFEEAFLVVWVMFDLKLRSGVKNTAAEFLSLVEA